MLRKRMLPAGWYPDTQDGIQSQVSYWKSSDIDSAFSVVVPHAGWFFSGELAYMGISSLREADVIVVAGGHLAPESPVMCITEEEIETPLGNIRTESELIARIMHDMSAVYDKFPDNTVEIQLPIVRLCQPDARVVGLRCPPDSSVVKKLARLLYDYAQKSSITLCVIGSTDLTHYGPQYGFSPVGKGDAAKKWVRDENDRAFIDALISLDVDTAIGLANSNLAACSAGGAVLAAEYARLCGVSSGRLLAYRQSCDVYPSDSFVGYASVVFA
ncbi:AmmeMemoRadiSam system protein B [Spirochaetia bacterium 38H-sp]|uniref:AmmeMemoRadiSam system protein B n=1 Tax=Rarispira pelagica TaxID=3141764 RepID=A0ABU9UBP9_9SPIR